MNRAKCFTLIIFYKLKLFKKTISDIDFCSYAKSVQNPYLKNMHLRLNYLGLFLKKIAIYLFKYLCSMSGFSMLSYQALASKTRPSSVIKSVIQSDISFRLCRHISMTSLCLVLMVKTSCILGSL